MPWQDEAVQTREKVSVVQMKRVASCSKRERKLYCVSLDLICLHLAPMHGVLVVDVATTVVGSIWKDTVVLLALCTSRGVVRGI